ncbi:Dirigent protein 25 [Bienertia sinuspersici]
MSSYKTPLPFFIFLLFESIITPSYSARTLLHVANPPQTSHQPTQPSITFIMQDVHPTKIRNPQQEEEEEQQQQQQQQQLPFAKPLRTFPLTYGGIPLPYQNNPNKQKTPTQTFDIPKFGIAFTATTKNLQEEMEFGLVTNIEEEIYDGNSVSGPTTLVGKSRGVYVAMNSSEDANNNDNNSHMMAMTVKFSTDENAEDDENSDDEVDRLKLFGVHNKDVMECHVAVIGGTGKFKDANGFAVIKVLSGTMMLLYNVYLS